MEQLRKDVEDLKDKLNVDENALRILEEETIKMAVNVNKLTKALLETPINGYLNVPDALHHISKCTEGMRDRYSFLESLKKLKDKNKPLYYFTTYTMLLGLLLFAAVHLNALVHPFGYSVDYVGSAKQQKVVIVPIDSSQIQK